MTEQQKEAIKVLNKVREHLTDEEYFSLMDFVVTTTEQTRYVPVTVPQIEQPQYPWEHQPWVRYETIC